MISIYLISIKILCYMETEPTTPYKDMPEFKFMKVIEKRYVYILNITYLAPLITSPGQDCNFR